MDHIGSMFFVNLFDRRWFQSSIVSGAGGGSQPPAVGRNGSVGAHEEGGRTTLGRTRSHVPTPAEMKKVFEQFDENKDGQICSDELSRFMEKLGFKMTFDEVKSLVKTVDEDCNGYVDFDEFYKLYSTLSGADADHSVDDKAHEEEHEKNLESAFKVFDKNGDGFISVEELQSVLKSLGMKEGHSYKKCQQMIKGVDADGNGKVDFEEFKKLMAVDAFQS